jgi:hypothetical protein
LPAVFKSDFLFVTGAFSFSRAGFSEARDEDFAFDALAFAAVFGATLATDFVAALLGVFALLADAAAVFFTAGFAIDLPEAGLVAADFAFFAVTVDFAVFFIAFAMESIPTDCSRAPSGVRLVEPICCPGSAFARATFS